MVIVVIVVGLGLSWGGVADSSVCRLSRRGMILAEWPKISSRSVVKASPQVLQGISTLIVDGLSVGIIKFIVVWVGLPHC